MEHAALGSLGATVCIHRGASPERYSILRVYAYCVMKISVDLIVLRTLDKHRFGFIYSTLRNNE